MDTLAILPHAQKLFPKAPVEANPQKQSAGSN